MKKFILKPATFILSLYLFTGAINIVNGNNVRITNLTRTGVNNDVIQFNLSWDNSWMVAGVPNNHDAVWVFVKFRECGVTINDWSHALLSTNMASHTFGPDITFATPILTTNRFGTGSGHNTGVMIRRANTGTGNIVNQTVRLQIVGSSNGVVMNPAIEYDINVFGIEMVYVPQGSFFAGDGFSTSALWQVGSSPPQPHFITSEAPFATHEASVSWQHTLLDSFPKGFNSFYVMKYEITQGQYVDFLNTITTTQQINRAFTTFINRHDIHYNGLIYFTNSSDRVKNYLSFNDLLAYLDWAALRPMTELEFEKACRGRMNFVQGEHAWGSGSVLHRREVRFITGATPGIEVPTDSSNCHIFVTQQTISGGQFTTGGGSSPTIGPVAAGIFARQTHQQNRIGTGATYYGIMEMSGNVWEQCIQVNTTSASNNPSPFTGIWGDGQLNASGFHNVHRWPTTVFYIQKGGSFATGSDAARVSDRSNRGWSDYVSRFNNVGGRGVR